MQQPQKNSLRFMLDNQRRNTEFIQATTELVEKAGMTKLLKHLESAIETKADERMIREMMEQMDSKFTECMILAKRKVQPSA